MSAYIYNNHSVSPPPGTITNYLGVSDPEGWLICDGTTRTATDGRYANLASILNTAFGINTNTSNSITTPDLRNKFLCGKDNYNTVQSSFGGSSTVTLTTNNMPNHSHYYQDAYYAEIISSSEKGNYSGRSTNSNTSSGFYFRTSDNKFTTDINNAQINTTTTGSGTPFSILPPYASVNYIIKY